MKKQNKVVLSIITAISLLNHASANDTTHLDSVTVTAQKVEENVQKVPISINVVDEFLIEDKNINKMEDLTKVTPSFSFVNQGTSGVGSPTIRGIHGDFHNFNTPIVMLVDGVPILNGYGYNTSLFDVNRVEVLRGPQGTLYGKNAEAGVINIISNKPNNDFKGKVALTLGSDNKQEASVVASGPIIEDKLYLGIALKNSKKDGFLKNTYINKTVGDREDTYGKINIRATPNDNLDISLISSIVKYNDGDVLINSKYAQDKEVQSDFESYNKSTTSLTSLKVAYDINNYKFESITAYRKYKDNAQQDWDFSNTNDPNYQYTWHEKRSDKNYAETTSQEFHLSSESDKVSWLTGIYADKDRLNFHSEEVDSSYLMQDPIKSTSIGLFGHLTYNLDEKLALLTGIRYDKENKEHELYNEKKEFSATSPKLAVNYNLSQNSMFFASVTKGYRAGGFNSSSTQEAKHSFEQESLLSYEIGTKNQLLDNKLLLNLSLYYMDISDMQVKTAINPYSGYTSNAAEATSQGLEVELNYNVTDNFTFFTTASVNKSKFEDFKDNTFDSSGTVTGTVNYKGNDNIYSPKYTYNLGFTYRADQGYFVRADLSGFSSMYTDKENTNKVDGYRLVDTKIGYEQDSYEFYLYGKNIFDKEHNIEGYNNDYTIYSEPREIGVQLAYRF